MKKLIIKIILLLIITLILIIIRVRLEQKKVQEIEFESVQIFKENIRDSHNSIQVNNNIRVSHNSIQVKNKKRIIKYDMVIEIPKINLSKGILKKYDKNNNVDKNVTILKESSYPDKEGNIFIAAHSGTGIHSYFRKLDKLDMGDKVYLYYKNKKYKYFVIDIKEVIKSSKTTIKTQKNNSLVLITCSPKNKGNNLIIELEKE